jgi:hypothetical protein
LIIAGCYADFEKYPNLWRPEMSNVHNFFFSFERNNVGLYLDEVSVME